MNLKRKKLNRNSKKNSKKKDKRKLLYNRERNVKSNFSRNIRKISRKEQTFLVKREENFRIREIERPSSFKNWLSKQLQSKRMCNNKNSKCFK